MISTVGFFMRDTMQITFSNEANPEESDPDELNEYHIDISQQSVAIHAVMADNEAIPAEVQDMVRCAAMCECLLRDVQLGTLAISLKVGRGQLEILQKLPAGKMTCINLLVTG